jgi:pimeloyl-ACP methyl ester carboxylesterase
VSAASETLPGPPLPTVPGVAVEHRTVALPDGTRLHVAQAGAGPPLVLVHGWPQHWWAWRKVMPALAQEHRVLCPDLRGLGWSDAPSGAYAKEDWAADLVALLDALGLERADLVGHDWGGLAALLAAVRAPERFSSVAALSIVHPWPPAQPRSLRGIVPLAYQLPLATPLAGEQLLRRLPAFVRELIRRGSHPDAHWRDDELDAYADVLRAPARARASSAVYRTFLTRELAPMAAGRDRRRLRVRALVLTGAADPVVRPRMFAGLERHADAPVRTEVVERAGHFVPEEQPEALVSLLRDHLRAV